MQITRHSEETDTCRYCGKNLPQPCRRQTAVCRPCRQIAVIRMFVEIQGEMRLHETSKDPNPQDLRQVPS